jgi:hypothetical protein
MFIVNHINQAASSVRSGMFYVTDMPLLTELSSI